MEQREEEEEAVSYAVGGRADSMALGEAKDELALASFKSMLEEDWYLAHGDAFTSLSSHHARHHHQNINHPENMLLQPLDSSSSCSPSSVFTLDPSQSFFPQKNSLSSLLGAVCPNPFEASFDLCESSGILGNSSVVMNRLGGGGFLGFGGYASTDLVPAAENFSGGEGLELVEGSQFLGRPKVIRPLEIFPPTGAPPTLYQKRAAAFRRSTEQERRKRKEGDDDMDEASVDGSGLNYDSDDLTGETGKPVNGELTGDQKGKKKGLPAKNLMAERRRRKKLNDRLYMLRSVVPKITKVVKRWFFFLGFEFRVLEVLCDRWIELLFWETR